MAFVGRGGARAHPSHYVTSVRAGISSPEKRLLMAVLLDAIEELKVVTQSAREGSDARHRKLAAWFAARDVSWPFSFENVCEHLDLNADCIRSRLSILAEQPSIHTRRATRAIK